jgi:hypothetical protein
MECRLQEVTVGVLTNHAMPRGSVTRRSCTRRSSTCARALDGCSIPGHHALGGTVDMADWYDEVREALGFLNFFGHVELLKEALTEPDKAKAFKTLVDYFGRMYVTGYSVHDIGVALRGKADCALLAEMDAIRIGSSTLRRTDEDALELSKATDKTKQHFRTVTEESDEKMWAMYQGLARLTARLMQSYYSDLRMLDRHTADNFLNKLKIKLTQYGCGQALRFIPPSL